MLTDAGAHSLGILRVSGVPLAVSASALLLAADPALTLTALGEIEVVSAERMTALAVGLRSEERRVGKECRSRCDWSSDVCSSDLCERPAPCGRSGTDADRAW